MPKGWGEREGSRGKAQHYVGRSINWSQCSLFLKEVLGMKIFCDCDKVHILEGMELRHTS